MDLWKLPPKAIGWTQQLQIPEYKKGKYQLTGIYLKEQTEFIQNKIDKIRDYVEDKQSRIAWQTINEVSRRKSTAKAKLKAAN